MKLYKEHYNKISTFRYNFEKVLERLKAEDNFEIKLELAMYCSNYLVYNNSGYFTSSVLENFFLDFAKKIKVDLRDIAYSKNSVLHVMSEGYKTGGHTRVVERWIDNAPNNQKHSVVFTRKNSSELTTLENNIKNKNGESITLGNEMSLKEKAIELRKLAMKYEFVVLHTHMEDPIPIIAFGVEEFKRPVFLYNHASHMAWLGKSIADLVLDIENEDEVTKIKRGISNTYFLGVPSKKISLTVTDKIAARKKLNLPLDKKIIVTSGGDARFRIICGNSFIDYLKRIMDDNTYCYVIGVKPKSSAWKKIKKETNNHVKTIGFIDFDKGFLDYLKAADLYLDSYPLCGGTAMIDAISSGTTVLSLKSVYPQFDYLTKTSAYCKTKEEFIDKAKRILNDRNYANEIFNEVKESLMEYQSIDAWNKKIDKLFEIAPKEHKINNLTECKDYCEDNDLSVLCNVIVDKKFLKTKKYKIFTDKDLNIFIKYGHLYKKQGIPFLFQVLSYKKSGKKAKVFKLFNIEIFKKFKK